MIASTTRQPAVVVTGAAGFIGSHLVDALLRQGYRVTGIDRRNPHVDPMARLNLAQAFTHARFTYVNTDLKDADLDALLAGVACVFHLAAVPGVRASWGPAFAEYTATNIGVTQRVVEACERNGVTRLVYASSSSVYGPASAPSRETDTPAPLSPYGVSKLAGEQICLAYAARRKSKLAVTALRYFTVYGPRQRPDMAIGRLLAAALTGVPYTLFGDGSQRRDYTYVGDVVKATMAAGRLDSGCGVVNIAGGASVSMIDLLSIVRELTGNSVLLTMIGAKDGDVVATAADLTRARAILGYRPGTDLRTGMARHAEWLRQLDRDLLSCYASAPVIARKAVPG